MQAGTGAKLGTGDEQAALAVEVEQSLPSLALPVLDHVRFIQDQVLPLLAPEHLCILHAHLADGESLTLRESIEADNATQDHVAMCMQVLLDMQLSLSYSLQMADCS